MQTPAQQQFTIAQVRCRLLYLIILPLIMIMIFSLINGCIMSDCKSQVAADGGCERDVVRRMNDGYKEWECCKVL